jgi:hypothetical protein
VRRSVGVRHPVGMSLAGAAGCTPARNSNARWMASKTPPCDVRSPSFADLLAQPALAL